ncbi:hypothetical protein [Sphingomonas japonica]|uniref:Uncharacterized protein n=1 Tax=Sphingomonas japonica TaxID=511662 RepID=A0ABX0TW00_9SPHN|nr:hypothetical protein [Sphingomonas japonica]NIJ22494.1 hypothetical protein [Sphingomonas japonica]
MTFDPSTVDLSEVEPALQEEVLRRITIIENFIHSKGVQARKDAVKALGLGDHMLYLLTRAWQARHRAEDITLRATKRAKPTTMDPAIIDIIRRETDAQPGARKTAIFQRVSAAAVAAGLTPPRYPTVNRYVRERLAELGPEDLPGFDHDIIVDLIVCDMPVDDGQGGRIRPQLVTAIDGRRKELVAMTGTTDNVHAADVARALAEIVDAAVVSVALGGTTAAGEPVPVSMSIPHGFGLEWDMLSVALRRAGVELDLRPIGLKTCGLLATALLGTAIAGYKLRPRLVGSSRAKREAAYIRLAPAAMPDAIRFLKQAVVQDRPAAASALERLGAAKLERLALDLSEIVTLAS